VVLYQLSYSRETRDGLKTLLPHRSQGPGS